MDLQDFLGHWRFDRQVLDSSGGLTGTVTGRAEISGSPESAIYAEAGTLTLPGQAPMVATRRYLWRAGPRTIEVKFDDARPFHQIALQGSATASHWCDPDDYQVAYDFSRWPDWQSDWRVIGPRKNYRLITRYARA